MQSVLLVFTTSLKSISFKLAFNSSVMCYVMKTKKIKL